MNSNQARSNSSLKTSSLYKSPAGTMSSPKDTNDKLIVQLGDGWCTFPDLDNFDSDKLLRALTLQEADSADSIWDPSLPAIVTENFQDQPLTIAALRQLEALFNLTQLLFGLSRSETVNYTFRDLQFRRHPHSFKKSGFKMLNTNGRVDFYLVFERLVRKIIDHGGLEIAMLMYRTPCLVMVRQKSLDLISNVATVPEIAYKILDEQAWFLDHLLIMIRDGDIVTDKIPAIGVLIRLLKIMLTKRMFAPYSKLVDLQYIDCIVDTFDNVQYTDSAEFLPFFVKFEFISMQSLTVILGDAEFSRLWSDKAKVRLVNYCMIVLLKAVGAYPLAGDASTSHIANQTNTVNHIFYAEQHTNKHSLAHTLMTITELLRNDANMKFFYRYHKPFKQLIIQLYKKYGAKSEFSRIDPGISYALNHLMRVLYIKNGGQQQQQQQPGQSDARVCSNPACDNEETKFKEFRPCEECDGKLAAYCSRKCLKSHLSEHLRSECNGKEKVSVDAIHASLSRTKRLSKYSSMNEHHRRTSLTFNRSRKFYTKHTSSMKEIKSKESFVRPLKTSTHLCLTELTGIDSSSSSSSGSERRQPSKKAKTVDNRHVRRHSDVCYNEQRSVGVGGMETAGEGHAEATIEHASEEIEAERFETNETRALRSANRVESPENSDFKALDSSASSSANQDDHDRRSEFKVINEFEKTLQFVENASKMGKLQSDKKKDDTLKQPHITLSSLYYDKDVTNIEVDSSDDDEEEEEEGDDDDWDDPGVVDYRKSTGGGDKLLESSKPRINLIINNSVSSSVSERPGGEDFVDDEMSVFKNETLARNTAGDYGEFKMPLLPAEPARPKPPDRLPLALQPIHTQSNEYLLKNNKIYNELKVFNNIGNLESSGVAGGRAELPKNSTPIYSDNSTAAYLTAKRKKLLNGKLDLTIAPPNGYDAQNHYSTVRKSSKENMFATSTLRSSNNLQTLEKKKPKLMSLGGEALDLSKLSAIENASANLIDVAKAEFPNHIKRKFKDEIRKDKTKCTIQ